MAVIDLIGVLDDGSKRAAGVPWNPRRTINVTRGESATLRLLVVRPSGALVDLGLTDQVILTVKSKPLLNVPLLLRLGVPQFARALVLFAVAPADFLNVAPGRYLYDIWLKTASESNVLVPASAWVVGMSVAAPADLEAPPPPPPPPSPGVNTGVFNCGPEVNSHMAVYLSGSDTVTPADADDPGKQPLVGFVREKLSPTQCVVQFSGELEGFTGLVPGVTYYLGRTPGGIVDNVDDYVHPMVVQRVGAPADSTTLIIQVDRDITIL